MEKEKTLDMRHSHEPVLSTVEKNRGEEEKEKAERRGEEGG